MDIGESFRLSQIRPNGHVTLTVLWVWFDSSWMIDGIYHPGDQDGEDLETAVNQCKAIGRLYRTVRIPVSAPPEPKEDTQ